MALIYPDCDSRVSHMRGVKAAVHARGRSIEETARALLAPHRRTGEAHIEGHREDTDYIVELVTPGGTIAALSIEFGRAGYTNKTGHQIGPAEGLHVLRRAAGI